MIMTTVQEIKEAITLLPGDQFSEIRDWIIERDWRSWDARIEEDGNMGRLDFLIDEAKQDRKSGDDIPL